MSSQSPVPAGRVREANGEGVAAEGRYVLYWMRSARRASWNFALDRACEWARDLGRPLVVFEGLRSGYRWASDRLHRFVIDGMADNAEAFERGHVTYYPRLEPRPGADRGLLRALAQEACVVVTDDYPAFFLPRQLEAAAGKLPVRLEAVDTNGILPMRSTDHAFPTAYAFRRYLQRELHPHLETMPRARPSLHTLPEPVPVPPTIAQRWPAATFDEDLADLPIDHTVTPAPVRGGSRAATRAWQAFLGERLAAYDEMRNRPGEDGASGLSPYLHFGHIAPHQVFSDLARAEAWTPEKLSVLAKGSRAGWWGMSESAEAFLDQLITWRELGFNMCVHEPDYERFESLPDWARTTIAEHADDPREAIYTLAEFEAAETHDELWNAAQRQLVREGRIHNYMRMLWGKKIYEWSPDAQSALAVMVELNNKYALDGRDPNSYSGIFWTLGRYDRAWGPERPVYGKLRYMSSKNTARKLPVGDYLAAHAAEAD